MRFTHVFNVVSVVFVTQYSDRPVYTNNNNNQIIVYIWNQTHFFIIPFLLYYVSNTFFLKIYVYLCFYRDWYNVLINDIAYYRNLSRSVQTYTYTQITFNWKSLFLKNIIIRVILIGLCILCLIKLYLPILHIY